MQVSAQWQQEVQADLEAPALPEVVPHVDWYDAHSEEVLVLTDAIQVKQQKARRGQGVGNPTETARAATVTTRLRWTGYPAARCHDQRWGQDNSLLARSTLWAASALDLELLVYLASWRRRSSPPACGGGGTTGHDAVQG